MNPGARSPSDRHIRVFISSTFRDMMRERDLLVKQVFPALRRICAKRFVTFTEVDLRWGITEEQAAEGKVLPLCLAEIERSRPYFIGLLGERYGWIPDSVPNEVIEREPWLKEHLHGGISVTELEILHGVLNNPEMKGHAFFYFRDPAYLVNPDLSDKERQELLERDISAEIEQYGPDEAARWTAERKEKLEKLKQRIRDSRLPLVEPYASPEALATIIEDQFVKLIDDLYPELEIPDPLDQERLSHEAHARNKLFACIDRPAHLDAITTFADLQEHTGKGLVITGESGSGKTALLASWVRDRATSHPEDFIFQHYFGATPDSASPEGFLRRLLGELKNRFGITEEIPLMPDKLREALPLWLAQTVNKGRIVLILDGLNQVQGGEPDLRLNFLPRYFPPHVTVIASSLSGPALDALRERQWVEHELLLATDEEVNAMVSSYLGIHARSLGENLHKQIVTAYGARNPLFLRTVLEELRQFGSFEHLPAQLKHYLEAENPKELFLRVIRRWQGDFDSGMDLVSKGLSYLWAARHGLSESEWLDLLGSNGNHLPRAHWTPFFLALEPHLSQRSGLFAFGHDFIRQAVEAEFFQTIDASRAAHLAVADYFDAQEGMTPRKAAEWPWQLHATELWIRLEACLTNIPLFLALYNERTKWELTGFWHSLRALGRDMGTSYINGYKHWSDSPENTSDPFVPAQLGQFLSDNGIYLAAESLLQRALADYEQVLGVEHLSTLTSVNNLAYLLSSKGDNAGAQPLYERALEVKERVLGQEHPDTLTSVNNLACLLSSKGDYVGAQPLYERALKAAERVLGPEHPFTLTSVNNLAALLDSNGDYVGAQPLYERALRVRERVLGAEHPSTMTSVNNLAVLLYKKGDYAGAQILYERALEVKERVLGPEHPDTLISVNNLAELLKDKGDYAGAQILYDRGLEVSERVLGAEHPDTLSLINNLAGLLYRKGDNAGAQILFDRALEVSERVLGPDHPSTMTIVNNLAVFLSTKGDHSSAQIFEERALELAERYLDPDHPSTMTIVNNLAVSLSTKGDYAGAQPLYERALEVTERVLGPEHPSTMTSVNNLAVLLCNKGDYAGAQTLLERALRVRERVLGAEHPNTLESVKNLATFHYNIGDYASAQPLYEEALKRLLNSSRVIGQPHPNLQSFASNLAGCLLKRGYNQEQIMAALRQMAPDFFGGNPSGIGDQQPVTPEQVRNTALELYKNGKFDQARELLEALLNAGFEVLSTRLHLARVALMTNNYDDAERHIADAWAHRNEAQPYVIARILWMKVLLAMLDNSDKTQIICQLKSVIQSEGVHMEWTMQPVLDHLESRLSVEDHALLTALVDALSSREKVADLDNITEWHMAKPEPIE